ncbi:hypothetical protein PTSG_12293 [Salpingoeca rosetta]|uniref:Uncharacterized protein n=1 Tax=Salpingoeca rosetta (strain ATCC 50818 / BSB-021) TaxID=946362 RepID=F2UA39_SALR5|nr:uncharacterized protein PTSG_12293 [Salpingoeca rosetta]EGD73614.1 hypothetical protein PTSG_12293 [Salpingoeca rosetta]|eukprot:XP_004993895.1 hypothetical protein PTSG_12293 [Salpingoeca rosetta]
MANRYVDYRLIPLQGSDSKAAALPALIGAGTVLGDVTTGELHLQASEDRSVWVEATWASLIVGFSNADTEASGLVATQTFVDAESGSIRRFTAVSGGGSCAVVDERLFAVHSASPVLMQDITIAHRSGARPVAVAFTTTAKGYERAWKQEEGSGLYTRTFDGWAAAIQPRPANATVAANQVKHLTVAIALSPLVEGAVPVQSLHAAITTASFKRHEEDFHRISRPFVSVQSPSAPRAPELHRYYLMQIVSPDPSANDDGSTRVPAACYSGLPLLEDLPASLPQSLTSLRDSFVKQWDTTFTAGTCTSLIASGLGASGVSLQLTRAIVGIRERDGGIDIAPGWLLPRDVALVAEDVRVGGYVVDIHLTRHHTTIARKDKRSHPVYIHRVGVHPKPVGVSTRLSIPSEPIHLSSSAQRPAGKQPDLDYGPRPISPPSYSTSLIVFLFVAIAGFHVALIRLVYLEYCR